MAKVNNQNMISNKKLCLTLYYVLLIFVTLLSEGEMFCLKQPKDSTISYYNLNRGSVTDTEMEEMLGRQLHSWPEGKME